ncbi:MAG: glycosyltransferase family 2 protein [Cytophagales bacterium]
MSHFCDFSIVVPTFNNKSELEMCFHSLLRLKHHSFEVLICDNGSEDGTPEMCIQWVNEHQNVRFFQHPDKKNHGRAANRNQALGRLNGRYVLFLDSDMVANENLLSNHLDVLNLGNSVSIGKVIYQDLNTNFWARYLSSRGVGKFKNTQTSPFSYFTTQNVALPTQWFESLGGFDASMKNYGGDDTEFAIRLKKTINPTFIFNSEATASSVMDKTIEKVLNQLEEFGATSLRYIHQKHPECKEIFHLGIFTGKSLKSKLAQLILKQWIYTAVLKTIRILPNAMAIKTFNYCVAFRIYKGFVSSTNP